MILKTKTLRICSRFWEPEEGDPPPQGCIQMKDILPATPAEDLFAQFRPHLHIESFYKREPDIWHAAVTVWLIGEKMPIHLNLQFEVDLGPMRHLKGNGVFFAKLKSYMEHGFDPGIKKSLHLKIIESDEFMLFVLDGYKQVMKKLREGEME